MSTAAPLDPQPETGAIHPAARAVSAHPLDDVMLAMDVVDTLRRRERLVSQALDEQGRDEALAAHLRKIYSAQGIEVPDHVIAQGVAALREGRFTYQPPPPSLATRLAHLYVARARWGKWVGAIAGVIVLAAGIQYVAFIAPIAALPERLDRVHAEAVALATSADARGALAEDLAAARAALAADDPTGARAALARLESARVLLGQEYELRIVNRPGARTGVWRIPDVNSSARNYYILVEAVDPTGRVLEVPIRNEETRAIERVTIWGLRVDETTFNEIARDKADDGILQREHFGTKKRGELTPRYEMPTTGGAITVW